jgi:NDP-sugar pyrophosphorylase family protein
MKILILAAGLGTRLKELTYNKPKALVEFNGKPILEHLISNLKQSGFTDLVINVHHFADQIVQFLNSKNNFNINIQISDESKMLADTGGAILHAKQFLEGAENFIVYNADIYTDTDLSALISNHKQNNSVATLSVQNRTASRKLLFDENNYLCQWKNTSSNEIINARTPTGNLNEWSFSGIHIISNTIFKLITETGKFSVIDLYLRLAKSEKISAFETPHTFWFDLGQVETIDEAEKFITNRRK